MIVLDTNVFSELMLPSPEPLVVDWLDRQATDTIWITAVTVFEVRSGIEHLPDGRRRRSLEAAFDRAVRAKLRGRVLPFDRDSANAAGRREAIRIRQGYSDDARDTQIAGIVLARGALLATRNVRHFADLGARVTNPWSVGVI